MSNSIIDCFNRYGAVNCYEGTDKTTTHAYGDVYDALFTPLQSSATNILAIGIAGGFGCQAYSDYFTHAQIYGLDISDFRAAIVRANPRIHVDIGDVKSNAIIQRIGSRLYDFIIEDASHLPEDQIQHFYDYCKFVKPGGYYVIEDVHGAYLTRLQNTLEPIAILNGFELVIHDLRSQKGRFDDILFVFRKV